MSTPVVTVHEAVVGDGTSARSRSARRWRRARWPLALLALVVVAGILSALPEPRTSTLTLAPDNPGDLGARAAAQILGRQGVDLLVREQVVTDDEHRRARDRERLHVGDATDVADVHALAAQDLGRRARPERAGVVGHRGLRLRHASIGAEAQPGAS